MSPPYHLRPNKAADRFIFMEALTRISRAFPLDGYQYIGLGGPFMRDFAQIYRRFPGIRMTSVEREHYIHLRQIAHAPCRSIEFFHGTLEDYVATEMPSAEPVVAWLDFTGLYAVDLRATKAFIQRAAPGSILKVTFRASYPRGRTLEDKWNTLPQALAEFMPARPATLPNDGEFKELAITIYREAIEDACSAVEDVDFGLLQLLSYQDTQPMVSILGLVGSDEQRKLARQAVRAWEFHSKHWGQLHQLGVPVLSVLERLRLAALLPQRSKGGKALARRLGYSLDGDLSETVKMLDQYRRLHRAYPMFAEIDM